MYYKIEEYNNTLNRLVAVVQANNENDAVKKFHCFDSETVRNDTNLQTQQQQVNCERITKSQYHKLKKEEKWQIKQ